MLKCSNFTFIQEAINVFMSLLKAKTLIANFIIFKIFYYIFSSYASQYQKFET